MPKLNPQPQPTSEKAQVLRVSLSVLEAAKACGVSKSLLYNLMAAGELPFVKVRSRRLIRTADLEALLQVYVKACKGAR